jgi:putative chitinase
MPITKEQLKSIAPTIKEPTLSTYTAELNATMKEYEIDTPVEICMFLAQVLHESGACRYVKELADGKAYEGRKDLGNVKPGDGVKYKGRGLIQITGRANYNTLGIAFGIDFVNAPELLESPRWATLSAGWFWNSRKLNEIAKLGTEDAFLKVTKKINGGTNGLEDRKNYWTKAKKVFGI